MNEITRIIERIQGGDPQATERLLPLVYNELRRLAAVRLKDERADHTLTPTALVHEAYLRLVGQATSPNWDGREHFFSAAAEAMRRILIDHARQKNAAKRGGDAKRIEFHESGFVDQAKSEDLLALDEALDRLETANRDAATLVKLRFFVGMTNKQAAEQMQLSPRKADMLWSFGRAWLKRELSGDKE